MIIVNLKGGLGNQMFQYALGRRLALKNNNELKLDISGYPRQNLRSYRLNNFNIAEKIATDDEVKKLKYPLGFFSKAWRRFSFKILRIHHVGWEPQALRLLEQKKNLYLDGFWQSYKFFDDIVDVLKRDFTLREPMENIRPDLLNKIKESNSVSIHIRRTDYVSTKRAQVYHGMCDLDYYQRALELIKDRVSNPAFFIFSDDIEWVKNNLPISDPALYVSQEGLEDYQELTLMSKCKHNIIANSSFSWWAAWLNSNPDKTVITPKQWFGNNSIKIDDIVLPTWTKI